MSLQALENESPASLSPQAEQASSTNSPKGAGKDAQANNCSRIADMLTELTLEDLNGTEDDDAVIAALTADDRTVNRPDPLLSRHAPGLGCEDELEPKTMAPSPHIIRVEYSRPRMADVTDEYLDGWLARSDEPPLARSTVCIGGNADRIDELLAGLDGGVEVSKVGELGATPSVPLGQEPTITNCPIEELLKPDLTLDDLNGTENDEEIIRQLTAPPTDDSDKTTRAQRNLKLLSDDRDRKRAKALENEQREYDRRQLEKREKARLRKQKQRHKERVAIEKSANEHLKELDNVEPPPVVAGKFSRQYHLRRGILETIANQPGSDSFLAQIRGRADEIAFGWLITQHARKMLGPKVSLAQIARHHPDKAMTKSRIQKLLKNIARLEKPGGPWHGLGDAVARLD